MSDGREELGGVEDGDMNQITVCTIELFNNLMITGEMVRGQHIL